VRGEREMNGKYGGWDWTSQRKGKVLETVKQKNKKQTNTQTNKQKTKNKQTKKQKQTKRVSRQTRKKQSNKTKQATNIEKGVLLAAKYILISLS
jgi:predicted ribosome quality control (RQC) complex YloA/Tae2 family protein